MKEKTNEFLDDIIKAFELDERITTLKNLKQKILSNSDFTKKLERLKKLDIYTNEYKELKKELFKDNNFILYKQTENELNLLIMEINQKLKSLTDERGCNICE